MKTLFFLLVGSLASPVFATQPPTYLQWRDTFSEATVPTPQTAKTFNLARAWQCFQAYPDLREEGWQRYDFSLVAGVLVNRAPSHPTYFNWDKQHTVLERTALGQEGRSLHEVIRYHSKSDSLVIEVVYSWLTDSDEPITSIKGGVYQYLACQRF
ncbi:hypothetical protein K2X33_01630 [bacterium]|nr:hypothetical protein [bacterium]